MAMKIVLIGLVTFLFSGIFLSLQSETTVILDEILNAKDSTRLENFLVYFSYQSSGKTPANQWGHEISVDSNNVVIETATNVSMVPGGYAISGHGTKKNLLMNVGVGDIVEVNFEAMTVKVIRDGIRSPYFKSKISVENATTRLTSAQHGLYSFDVENAISILDQMQQKYQVVELLAGNDQLSQAEIQTMKATSDEIAKLAEDMIYATSKSEVLEIRALWHRPNASLIKETNLAGVISFVQKVKELGFNTLYVETLWNGYVSYRSELMETHPQVRSYYYGEAYRNDYIAALIGEANKLGIDVHAWSHTFNAGNVSYKASTIENSWLTEDYQGNTLHPNSYGGSYYLDPSNQDALDFLTEVYVEMASRYNFAGIQLDYIRYYDNNYKTTPIKDSGYGALPEEKFKQAYELTGNVRSMILNTGTRELWNEWRQNNVTEAVRQFSAAIRNTNPKIVISADVVADITSAKKTYMQDWITWVQRGYIDLLCPMIYTGSANAVAVESQAIKNSLGHFAFLSSGIAPIYYGHSVLTNHQQIEASAPTGGSAIFASQNVIGIQQVEDSLKLGRYRNDAVSPLRSVSEIINQVIASQIDYLSQYGQQDPHQVMILAKLNEIMDMDRNNPSDYKRLMNEVKLASLITAYLENQSVKNHLEYELDRLADVLDIKITRELIALSHYDPSSSARPDPDNFTFATDEEKVLEEEPGDQDESEDTSNLWKTMVPGSMVVIAGSIFVLLKKGKRITV